MRRSSAGYGDGALQDEGLCRREKGDEDGALKD